MYTLGIANKYKHAQIPCFTAIEYNPQISYIATNKDTAWSTTSQLAYAYLNTSVIPVFQSDGFYIGIGHHVAEYSTAVDANKYTIL